MNKIAVYVNWTRKAWLSATAVVAVLTTAAGVPTDVKAWAVEVAAFLGSFGLVFGTSNGDGPQPNLPQ